MAIKNIIFDLGGVILYIDYQLTEKAFRSLGCKNFDELYSQARQTTLFDDFEVGKIDEAVFFYKLKNLTGLEVTQQQLKGAWNAMLIELPQENYELLKFLKNKYRLFLLSNTNPTHIAAFTKLVEKVCSIEEFEGFFERVYYSSYMGLKKPNATPFLKILIENGLSADQTLFIDDSIQHIKGAAKTRMQTAFLEKGNTAENLLRGLKLL